MGWDSKMNIQPYMEEIFCLFIKKWYNRTDIYLGSPGGYDTLFKKMNLCNTECEFRLPEDSDKYVALLLNLIEKCTNFFQFTGSQISKQTFDWLGTTCSVPATPCCCPGCPHGSSTSTSRRNYCPALNLPEALSMRNCSMLNNYLNNYLLGLLTTSCQTFPRCCFCCVKLK